MVPFGAIWFPFGANGQRGDGANLRLQPDQLVLVNGLLAPRPNSPQGSRDFGIAGESGLDAEDGHNGLALGEELGWQWTGCSRALQQQCRCRQERHGHETARHGWNGDNGSAGGRQRAAPFVRT